MFFPIAAKTLVSGKDNSDGRKNAVSVKQFNAFKKLTTTGTGLKHYELLTFQKAKNYSTARVTRQSLYKCTTKAIEKNTLPQYHKNFLCLLIENPPVRFPTALPKFISEISLIFLTPFSLHNLKYSSIRWMFPS